MKQANNPSTVANTVLDFYRELPFNQHSTVSSQIDSIRNRNPVVNYPVLPPLLNEKTRVLEVGSGTGWFANSISHYHGAKVTGIDFNPRAVEFSKQVAEQLAISGSNPEGSHAAEFATADLFSYQAAESFDLVISLGVLHHTGNCHGAVERLCRDFVKPGGHVFIGLYHRHGRRPFLQHFKDMSAAGASEEEMLDRYRQLHSAIKDETHLRSWFRDQVQHPHETQHTLAEMIPILTANGLTLCTSSINRFAPIENDESISKVLAMEPALEDVAATRLLENQYFPGFFLFLAQKQ